MLGHVAGRMLQAAIVMLVMSALVFVGVYAIGNPIDVLIGPDVSQDIRLETIARYGLDQPLWRQYFTFLGRILHGDFGRSFVFGMPVLDLILSRLPATLELTLAAVLGASLIGIPAGIYAGYRPDGLAAKAIMTISILGFSVPTFWVGLVLVRFVALPTGWFPVSGFGATPSEHLRSVVLPAVSLSLALAPVIARSLRTSMVDVLESDYVMAARATGIGGWRLFRWYILRNSLSPAVSLLAVQVGFLLFGVVVLEVTFDIHGLGSELVTAAVGKDLLVTQGVTLVFAIAVVAVNIVADLLLVAIDPRVTAS